MLCLSRLTKHRPSCRELGKHWLRCLTQRIFWVALAVALPNGVLTALFKTESHRVPFLENLSIEPAAFGSFSFLIGLFVAFRASQAYNRYWEGTTAAYHIRSHFFDVANSLIAFCRCSKADQQAIAKFEHLVVRLVSILHSLVLVELSAETGEMTGSEPAWEYPIINPEVLDQETFSKVRHTTSPVDTMSHWIQSLVVRAMDTGVIGVPAPICTRVFQELNGGICQFHHAMKLTEVPFPFPYTAATSLVLALHWCLVPIAASTWSDSVPMVVCLSVTQVFALWLLDGIAQELENPFGRDANDLDLQSGHLDLNKRLVALLGPEACHMPQCVDQVEEQWKQYHKTPLRRLTSMRVMLDDVRPQSSSEASPGAAAGGGGGGGAGASGAGAVASAGVGSRSERFNIDLLEDDGAAAVARHERSSEDRQVPLAAAARVAQQQQQLAPVDAAIVEDCSHSATARVRPGEVPEAKHQAMPPELNQKEQMGIVSLKGNQKERLPAEANNHMDDWARLKESRFEESAPSRPARAGASAGAFGSGGAAGSRGARTPPAAEPQEKNLGNSLNAHLFSCLSVSNSTGPSVAGGGGTLQACCCVDPADSADRPKTLAALAGQDFEEGRVAAAATADPADARKLRAAGGTAGSHPAGV